MQVVIFNIGKEKFALETRLIHGIEKMMSVTKVPTAQHYVSGLANLRGNIITVIDLKKYFNIYSDNQQENIIIIEVNDEKIGLIVDHVQEVIDINDEQIEKVNNDNSNVKGVINFYDYIVTLIDVENIFN